MTDAQRETLARLAETDLTLDEAIDCEMIELLDPDDEIEIEERVLN